MSPTKHAAERDALLRRLQLLDTPPEEAFDRITRLATRLLGAPIALVNLITKDRQFFKSVVGIEGLRELPVGTGPCVRAMTSGEALMLEDARLDPRHASGPLVEDLGMIAYLGAPLVTSGGHALGTFCVADTTARNWTREELDQVEDLAAMTTTELELRLTEQALESERSRLAAVFEQAPAVMATARGPDHVFEMVNSHYFQVVGHRDILGKPVREALPEIAEQGIIELLDRVYATGEPFVGNQMPMDLQREAGGPLEERILNLVYQPIREPDGTISGILAHGVDVTEQARAQERIAAAEAHYRRLVSNSPQTIYGQDRDGGFTDLNAAGEALLGTTEREALGVHFREVVAPEDLDRAQDVFDRLMSGEAEQIEYELRVIRTDGEKRLIVVTATGIREGGSVVGVQGIARDITAERKAEEQIRLLAAALQNLKEGVSIARLDGRIIYANAAHARLLGYDPDARPLPNARELLVDEVSEALLEEIVRSAVEDGAWTGSMRLRRKNDGQVVPMNLIVGSIERGQAEPLVVTISRDISEEIERENHLRRTERLASLGTLVGGVAHELNNPLQAIQSFAELLSEEVEADGVKVSGVKADLATIQREAARAARIVSDLRVLARSTQNEPADRTRIDLNDIVRHVLHTRHYALKTGNVRVRVELAPSLPHVLADGAQMEQVLLNLVVNAEHAMAACEEPRTLDVQTAVAGTGVVLRVLDSGPGIPTHEIGRIFDPFWTTKSPGDGTGLGLALVHSIVTEHGGSVRAESPPGGKTEFRVELPAMDTTSTPAPERGNDPAIPDVPEVPARRLRILVVDDEDTVRRVFARFLVRRGHQVDVACEGGEALRLLAGSAGEGPGYDVIVSDLRMPGLGGEELFRRLKALKPGMERRIVFMTGDAAGEDAARVLGALGAPVIYKPVKLRDAAATIESHAGPDAGGSYQGTE